MKLVLVVNRTKEQAVRAALDIASWCRARGIECVEVSGSLREARDAVARAATQASEVVACARTQASDLVACALGGDGTVLRAAAIAVEHGIPVLGVNVGSLGFLSQTSLDLLFPALESLARGEYSVEGRMRLGFESADCSGSALNDLVVAAVEPRLLKMSLSWGGEPATALSGDGMIFSTPTGTTAYSLSLGGPIVVPTAECLVVTSHAAHVLGVRSLVFSRDDTIQLSASAEVRLVADGDEVGRLPAGREISVRRAANPTLLVRPAGARGFFATLTDKLNWPGTERRQAS